MSSSVQSKIFLKQGFSTVEAVLAAMVFLMITSSIYVLFNRSQRVFVSQNQLVAAQQNARSALDYMTETISLAGFGVPSPQVYQTIVRAADLTSSDGIGNVNKSAFTDFGTFSASSASVDATHIYLKGCFGKIYGSLIGGLSIPTGSSTFPSTSANLNVGLMAGSFSTNDKVMMYDFNPNGLIPFYWVYGTISSISTVSSSPPVVQLTIQFTDGTIPGSGPFGGYNFGQGTMIYKVETRAYRLNGTVIEVSDNGNPYETLIDHVSSLAFHYFDSTNTEITPPINTIQGRAAIQKVTIQLTTQAVSNDTQTNQPLTVTYSSTATPRNFQFSL